MQYIFILPSRRHELRSVIELFISEIQADVNRNFNKVQHVEEEAQEDPIPQVESFGLIEEEEERASFPILNSPLNY